METLTVPVPTFVLTYNKRDITADLTPFKLSVSYTDNLDGDESDSIELSLEDTDGRWWDAWYPVMGDQINLKIGYEGQPLVNCGDFEIDEIEIDGPPSQVRIRALAASVMKDLRTHQGKAYEDTTLAGIAQAVATRHKLTVVGEIEPIPITRVTQLHEEDLKFLKRVAREYGYAFNVRGDKLTFYRLDKLRAASSIQVIKVGDLSKYGFRDKVKGTPKKATVAYHDPKKKAVVAYDVDSNGQVVSKPSGDSLKLNTRAESPEQAQAKAKAAINHANDEATTATLNLWGNPKLVAGINVELEGFGKLSGRYQVAKSRHDLSRGSGYTTEIEVRRVEIKADKNSKNGGNKLKVADVENGKVVLK